MYVYSGNKTFRIQKKEYVKYYSSMPDNGSLMGYIRIKGKQPNPGENETTLTINNKEYSVFDDNKGKLIGYLKTEDKDSYIGLTVKRTICPKWLIMLTHGMIYSSPAAIVTGLCITGAAIGGGKAVHLFSYGNSAMAVFFLHKKETVSSLFVAITDYSTLTVHIRH